MNKIEKLSSLFFQYSPDPKLFESTTFPPSLWELFHEMKSFPMTPHQVASLLEVDLPQAQELLEALLKENLLTVVGQNSYDEWLASQQPKIQLDEVTVIHEEKQESVFTSVETTSEEVEITSEEPQEEHTKLNEFSAPFYPEVIVDTDFEEEVSLIIG